jgi:hypothetical protein
MNEECALDKIPGMETPKLSDTSRALLRHLREDAITTGELSHWDPSYFVDLFGVTADEIYLASRELVSLGFVEVFDPGIIDVDAYPCRISDIVLTPEGFA